MNHANPSLERRFVLSLLLTLAIFVAEVAGGLISDSLALLSDAAHVFLDVLALAMSYAALRIAARPATSQHTYGFHRFEVLAALANGATLVIVALGILREAVERLQAPQVVHSGPMLVIAVIGLVVNLVVALVLREHDHHDLNVRGAFLHVLGDALGSVGVIVAAVVIALTGWTPVDAIVSFLIAGLILWSSWRLLRESLHVLVEGTPEEVEPAAVMQAMQHVPAVTGIHDLHIWSLCPGFVALTAHVVVDAPDICQAQTVQGALKQLLAEQFQITHVTLQLEWAGAGQCCTGTGCGA